jgi:hypothetical protein
MISPMFPWLCNYPHVRPSFPKPLIARLACHELNSLGVYLASKVALTTERYGRYVTECLMRGLEFVESNESGRE